MGWDKNYQRRRTRGRSTRLRHIDELSQHIKAGRRKIIYNFSGNRQYRNDMKKEKGCVSVVFAFSYKDRFLPNS